MEQRNSEVREDLTVLVVVECSDRGMVKLESGYVEVSVKEFRASRKCGSECSENGGSVRLK